LVIASASIDQARRETTMHRLSISLIFAATLASSTAAYATPTALNWSTYMRTAPADNATVIDEIEHDRIVDVRGCSAQWCQIVSDGVLGYIDADSVHLPRPPTGKAPRAGTQGCFWAGEYSYRMPQQTLFCQIAPGR
jgi:hypothetical protein